MLIRFTKHPALNEYLRSFKHRAVGDLAWSLLTPPLFENIPNFPTEWFKQDYIDDDLLPWLNQLDKEPKALYEHLLEQRSTRLGIYFEQLLSFYFHRFPRFTLIAKNLQVNDAQRTLGEFDFIIKDKMEGEIKHIEVAIKFYIGHSQFCGHIKNNIQLYNWHQYIGPNQKETLSIKMCHLHHHQLPLVNTPNGKITLNAILFDKYKLQNKKISSRLLIKGRFYSPYHEQIEPPTFSNKNLRLHHWLDTNTLFSNPSFLKPKRQYCILPKSCWLNELTKSDLTLERITLFNKNELLEKVKNNCENNNKEWQIAELDLLNNHHLEIKRFFVINSQSLQPDG